jgi:hypothetical protein
VGWLRTIAIVVVALSVAAGVIGALTVASRTDGLNSARHVSEPLVVDAQKLVVDLTDANTTIAGGFLDRSVVPVSIQSSYASDLSGASAALSAIAARAGGGSQVASLENSIVGGLPLYEATIATAEADNRQGLPLGAAYLTEANHLMSAVLLPAASGQYTTEQARLTADNGHSTSGLGEIAVIVLLVLVAATLIYMQVGLAGRFRRILSPAAILATITVVVLVAWTAAALGSEGSAVAHAERVGSVPLSQLTQERILDGRAVADDQLTLATHDAYTSFQSDYRAVGQQLADRLSHPVVGWTSAEAYGQAAAADGWSEYGAAHTTLNHDESNGDSTGAAQAEANQAVPATLLLDTALTGGVSAAVTEFNASAKTAAGDLTGLLLGGLLLVGLAVAATLAAVRPRIKEYR